MRVQKGGMVRCDETGVWVGENESGEADANFFNYLGLDCNDFWKLWRYPLMEEGIINSTMWTENNKNEILEYLEKIIKIRTEQIEKATEEGRREMFRDNNSTNDNHSKILTYVMQLRNRVRDDGIKFYERESQTIGQYGIDITKTDSYAGVVSEVGHMNPSNYNGGYLDIMTFRNHTSMPKTKGGKKSTKKKSTRKKSTRKKSTRKKSMKKKSMKKKSMKKKSTRKLHIIPDTDKTKWSSDFFGERQVINFKKYISKMKVDNLHPIKGKHQNSIKKEYARRLKLQLKKNKPLRKKFQKKTRKKYNSKTIDKQINNMSNKKLESVYKYLLKDEKTKR